MFNAENWGILWRHAINVPGPTIAAVALVVVIAFSLSRLIDRGEIRGLKEQKQAVRDILEFEKKKSRSRSGKAKGKNLGTRTISCRKSFLSANRKGGRRHRRISYNKPRYV